VAKGKLVENPSAQKVCLLTGHTLMNTGKRGSLTHGRPTEFEWSHTSVGNLYVASQRHLSGLTTPTELAAFKLFCDSYWDQFFERLVLP